MTLSNFFKKLLSPFVVGNCLGMAALGVALVAASMWFLQCYTDHGDTVLVPNIKGQTEDVARKKLEAIGLKVEVADTGYVDTYVGGVVLEQSLRPGQRVKAGRIVSLTINASSARAIALPALADNCSFREAKAKLVALGFKNIRMERTPGDRDWVYFVKAGDRLLQAGEHVAVTTLITLVIGNGDVDEEFNGNDSLDYELFTPDEYGEEGDAVEGETADEFINRATTE